MVPHINGNTPNELGSNSGVHVVPKKNSAGETDSKKLSVSENNKMTIAAEVTTDTNAHSASHVFIADSPQRTLDALIEEVALSSLD
jgi:hypothetical protein